MIWIVIGFIIFILTWKIVHATEYESCYPMGGWKEIRFPVCIWILLFFVYLIPILGTVLFAFYILITVISLIIGDVRITKLSSTMNSLLSFLNKYLGFLFKQI